MHNKLVFKYGTMGSGKSLDLIRTEYNYREHGYKTLVGKPVVDTRSHSIKTRAGLELPVNEHIHSEYNFVSELKDKEFNVLILDESQFLSVEQIDQLRELVDIYNITVICYGLKVDFKSELFPASKRLIEIADNIDEVTIGICPCGKKAKQHARFVNGVFDKDGPVVMIGDLEYKSLCNECYFKLWRGANE